MYYTTTDHFSTARRITRLAQRQIKDKTGLKVDLLLSTAGKLSKSPDAMLCTIANSLSMSGLCYQLKDKSRDLTELRFLGAHFLRKHFPGITLKQICVLFGGRDHTSILYSLTRATALLTGKDPQFSKKYNIVQKSINEWLLSEA